MSVTKFKLTYEWLHKYYGSHTEQEEFFARKWLADYGENVPPEKVEMWGRWKHLTEYQVNTNDIVDQCLSWVGDEFKSELQAHRYINALRFGVAKLYEEALDSISKPVKSILELGTGGDSAISTSVFLFHLEKYKNPKMLSVDRNPLGMTWERYKDVPYWSFRQVDSIEVLNEMVSKGIRWDLIFIDTIHSYTHTTSELNLASQITNAVLLDDADFSGNSFDPAPGGVREARVKFLVNNHDWSEEMFGGTKVSLMTRVKEVSTSKKGKPQQSDKYNLKQDLPKGVLNE